MKKGALWVLIPVVVFIAAIAVGINFMLHGTPWGKSSYRKEVVQYLDTHYKMKDGYENDVEYGFEEGEYLSYFTLSDGTKFVVEHDYKGGLRDTYLNALIEKELREVLAKKISTSLPAGKVRVDVIDAQLKEHVPSLSPDHVPPYDALPLDTKKSTQVFLDLQGSNVTDDEVLQELVPFIKWLKEHKYYAQYDVFWNGGQLSFAQPQIDTVQNVQDLQRQMTK